MRVTALLYLMLVLALAGCAVSGTAVSNGNLTTTPTQTKTEVPTEKPFIRHLVLIKLNDPSQRAALEADCDLLLASIPGVCEYSISHHVDTQRTNVDGDYDTALIIGFPSLSVYQAYLVHPNHIQLLQNWKPKSQKLRIFDFGA